ncbi:CocE/NonD family hydrolase [Eisenbergiella porci]|uniref:CocE/NonD family hydrolase n=1 Tax=Eisenbergiella porci TaxID=2652274 RepID=UPI0022E74C8B|nr:CocE/NonD family hydrolase [Eisenbergiella porci]
MIQKPSFSRISKYIEANDQTKLAVDIYLPISEERVPLLLKAGYTSRRMAYEQEKDAVHRFLNAGYAVAFMDVRGSGASFGTNDGFFGLYDGKDIKKVCDTLAAEQWCSGKVGMYGGSNYGMSQELVLAEEPDSLYAAIPCDCSMDIYDQNYPNGVSYMTHGIAESPQVLLGDPVDEDPGPDYPMARAAAKMHMSNLPFLAQYLPNMYRDSIHPDLGYKPNLDIPVWEKMDRIRFGRAFVWHTGAWFDPGCTNKILTYKHWGGKLILGPWMHTGIYHECREYPGGTLDWVQEYIHFFDAYLKEKEDPYRHEPPVRYYTIEREGGQWHYEADFPVEGTMFSCLYLGKNGKTTLEPGENGRNKYMVRDDLSIYGGMGRMNRDNRQDMTAYDRKAVCFTSAPIPEQMEITGIPILHLYVTSNNKDGNFIACLEEVTPDGVSHYLSEGMIRASHAKTHTNTIYNSLGIPYHRGFKEDRVELKEDSPLKLSFHLEALSRIIGKGSRIRITLSCGGSGFEQPEDFCPEGAFVYFHYGKEFPSNLVLPIIKPEITVFHEKMRTLYIFRSAVYLKENDKFYEYPCRQVYPKGDNTLIYETSDFTVQKQVSGNFVEVWADLNGSTFYAREKLPRRYFFRKNQEYLPSLPEVPAWQGIAKRKELYIATVPLMKGVRGNPNLQIGKTMDLRVTLLYPEQGRENYPCIINIHGYGGHHHSFDPITEDLLNKGYVIASLDYRLSPPNIWPMPDDDVRACIRYIKAHNKELHLNSRRFGVIGGSMGGYLAAMLAACNGSPDMEGVVGGCLEENCRINAAVVYFGFTDYFHFAEDSAEIWPNQPEKILQSDGPFAPLGCMIGHSGEGKGLGDVKLHWNDSSYRELVKRTNDASPISKVTRNSAPTCFVHGIYECGIQVPMGQSVRMFKALSEQGVKSFLLCNNNSMYGEDDEIKKAVIDFVCRRI